MSELLPTFKTELTKRGVDWNNLAVFMLTAGDQVIGEVRGTDDLVGKNVRITKPKRFVRLQKATQTGLVIDFMIADLDMVEDGEVQVSAFLGYRVRDLNDESQGRYFGILLDHLEQKEKERIERSGILLPNESRSPFVMPSLNLRGNGQ